MAASAVCATCGTTLRRGAKFCDECGARTRTAADVPEYKQVTVLFADVVRSMGIAAAVDIERLREIMTDLLERSAAVVRRYGGSVEHTGDGVMAIFGAPIALEDHAFRACLAALDIQEQTRRLASEVARRDGLELQVRTGLNSGRVIAGDIGSGSLGYAATGETVGMAQRMESVAPPGGVMLSESTSRLVERVVRLSEPQWVRIKGADEPVLARRLLTTGPPEEPVRRAEASLVGRHGEMAALDAMVRRMLDGEGGIATVVGAAGIGKSRVARELAALAADRGVVVHWAFCESHARDISFGVVSRLLRAGTGVVDLDREAARDRLRERLPNADPQDLLLLDDLLGVADGGAPLPPIGADARRRRLTKLVIDAAEARTEPVLSIIEDAQWIDAVSESMVADFLTVVARTPSMVLVTARPEYTGALRQIPGALTTTLTPLQDSDAAALLRELLGTHESVGGLATVIADRAAGNPFFAEEMVRELAQRGVLEGDRGRYVCRADVADVSVPATVQAAIEARIDRLSTPAKRTLNAASVIGARFEVELLTALGIEPAVDELLGVELIDQVKRGTRAEYAFRHPLIRAVSYESQLRADRTLSHRRLARAIAEREPDSVEENAALIAEHLEASGDLQEAYGWHMRAGAWSTIRDIHAARLSWERACRIADSLFADDRSRWPLRIAPRSMLCATDWQAREVNTSRGRFAELRELCAAAEDNVSLAIGMTGLATELLYAGRPGEGSRLASEQMALLESIGDANLTTGLAFVAFANWFNAGDIDAIARWSQTVIDLADGDPSKGAGFGVGSPLAIATAFRSISRWWLGRPGWREDLENSLTIARNSDPATLALAIAWTYALAIGAGVLLADDVIVTEIEKTVEAAARFSNDFALHGSELALALALLHRDSEPERRRGLELMVQARDVHMPVSAPSLVPTAQLWASREMARRGDQGDPVAAMRRAVTELRTSGRLGWALLGTGVLVDVLLERGTDSDLVETEETLQWLASLPATEGWAIRDIMLLRQRARLARARGDHASHHDLAGRYHTMAKSLGFEGHTFYAEALCTATQSP
ncbi:adenylate/guanylate cyclase family protein [Mycolicibacterium chubuense NBB4]|uniref:Adenylate/guanylate cyclase family protein n=1 Tax=Mycolicibacterium chubuense (strain NBB4) TaxID=710421 RepID=I4BPE0_MYCCN|nr:adenylate/guanylate cyclase domain-containing protein [Mycolicibacterium chubuense]AFM19147.1 adenylate/guanylate cyclase family protein [Mycolicibacterium chubuense NBB4]